MTTNEGWSFRDRSFLWALGASLLWHFFWFFSIQVTVTPSRSFVKAKPNVVALGPVLDDTIFKTLVQTRPQASEAFYRRLSDFSSAIEPPIKTEPRAEPGQVVSLPFGTKMNQAIHQLLGGDKLVPNVEFTRHVKRRLHRLLEPAKE